jgi:hypothetical protein
MAKATAPPFHAAEAEPLSNSLHCGVVVWGVIKDEVPDFPVWDLIRLQYFDHLVSDVGSKVSNCKFRDSKNKLAGLTIFTSEEACDAVQGVLIPRSPAIKGDMHQARSVSQYFNYLSSVFLELGNCTLANGIVTDMGISACNKWIEVLENGAQPLILGFSKRQVALDNPFDH